MQVKNKVVVVTGGASGIGKSLCERFAKEGASAIVVSDIDQQGIDATVADISTLTQAVGIKTNVGNEEEVNALVAKTLKQFGHIDLFCSNAGIFTVGGEEVSTEAWQTIWDINVMSHVFASRAVL
ncbi:MAG: short-chain dehydrogenase, partial [SAR86 cluster bacterium]